MSMDQVFLLALAILVVLIVLIGAWVINNRRSDREYAPPKGLDDVSESRIELGERQSSIVSEQIEEMVKQQLADDDELSSVAIDFGADTNGNLEYWIDGTRYTSIDDIPIPKIREAIHGAVASFND